ncbi:MAG: formate dehydrogenase accessory sulfurtransferase FdhD [Pseudomonadota bacterium]
MTARERSSFEAPRPSKAVSLTRQSQTRRGAASRMLIEEVPIALVFNGTTVAVMMASPVHIEDFAKGFALSERYISGLDDIEELEIISHASGLEARFWVAEACETALKERRRAMLGPIGCGLCGIESLDQALRQVPRVESAFAMPAPTLMGAFDRLRCDQTLHTETRSCHAAGFIDDRGEVLLCREDIGRHNALDKLIGAIKASERDAGTGAILMTSRLSVELIQKSAIAGCPILAGVSGPSALATRTAEDTGITLVGFCGRDQVDIFTHPERLPAR